MLFLWMLGGDFAWQMRERAITPIAQIMLRGFAAPDWLIGMLVGSVPSALGLAMGPIIGVKSDHHRGPWGRRIPFILVPTPFIVVLMIALAFTPEIGQAVHRLLGATGLSLATSRIAVFTCFWTVLEIGILIANGMVNGLVNDVVPQVVIGRFFALFRFVSLSAGVLFNYYLFETVALHFRGLLITTSVVYGAGFTVMCLKVKEGEYPPPPPPSDVKHGSFSPVISYLKECLSHPFFLWYFFATTLGGLAMAPFNTFSVFHSQSVGLSDHRYGRAVAISYACSMVLSYPIGMLADRIHPLRLGLITVLLYSAVTAFGYFYGTTPDAFYVALLLHTVISGCFYTGTASISQRLLPRDKYGEISSAGGIINGLCFMVLPPILGLIVGWTHHNYRFVFALGSTTALASAVAFLFLLRLYNKLGGDEGFMPPESAPQIEGVPPVQADPREQ